jgi:ribosomal protein S11
MTTNNVKKVWASGKAVVNAWLAIPSGFSAEVIAQKLQQARQQISIRSVERVISDFGLQKKTLRLSP